jgi:hypothetical protein
MAAHKKPAASGEDDPDSIAEYHRGADNSIKDVVSSISEERRRQGGTLSGVGDEDIREVEDPGDGKTRPETQRQREQVKGQSAIPHAGKKTG